MHISVILCTYNRCQGVTQTLSSIAASTLPLSVEWEVLVVDNNSSDQTREVVEDFCRQHTAHFRYVFEPHMGKSHALQTGIREARGDVIAFTDDDVTVEPTWLHNLTSELYGGEWAGAGGRIVLQWPASLPDWLATEGPWARHGLPAFDQGRKAKPLIGPPFGANMAFRKEMFEKHGGFRKDLGPSPNREIPRPGEDTEFGRRLIAGGERLRYEPAAVVYHPVAESRINKKYFLEWSFDFGRAHAREFQIQPVRQFCGLLAWELRAIVASDPQRRFFCRLVVRERLGEITEFFRRLISPKGPKTVAVQKTEQEGNIGT
jgi:glycosyltransferase involved in cell wall biosynthesis